MNKKVKKRQPDENKSKLEGITSKKSNSLKTYEAILAKWVYIILPLIVFIVYFHILFFNLVGCDDNEILIKGFDRLKDIGGIPGEFFKGYMATSFYRPIVQILFIINAQIGGASAFIYHFCNVVFHSLFVSLLFYLFRLLKFNIWIAFTGALFYAVSPLLVNAVAWIAGINDLTYSLFCLISFITFIRYLNDNKLVYLIIHALSFLFAVFSKETAVIFPLLCLGYMFLISKQKIGEKRNLVLISIWIAIPLIFYFIRNFASLGTQIYKSGFNVFLGNLPFIPEIIAKFLIPFNLSTLPTYNILQIVIGISVILIIIFLVLKSKSKRNDLVLFGILWFLLFSLPGMLVTAGNSADWNDYLECRAYFPMIGILLILFELIPKDFLTTKLKKYLQIAGVIIILFAAINFNVSNNYANALTFYENAVDRNPGRFLFQFYLSLAYNEFKDEEKAEKTMMLALKMNPGHKFLNFNLGITNFNKKKYDTAAIYFEKTIRIDSNYRDAYIQLSMVYDKMNEFEKMVVILTKADLKWKNDNFILFGLVTALLNLKQIDNAHDYAMKYVDLGNPPHKILESYIKLSEYFFKTKDYPNLLNMSYKTLFFDHSNLDALKCLYLYYTEFKKNEDKADSAGTAIIELSQNKVK